MSTFSPEDFIKLRNSEQPNFPAETTPNLTGNFIDDICIMSKNESIKRDKFFTELQQQTHEKETQLT